MPTQPDDHLDDEALSAVLDAEASPDEDAHASTCPRCASRLAVLRGVAAAVAAPPTPPPPSHVDAAVTAAIAAAPPTPIAADRRRHASRRFTPLAAAAVILVGLLLAVPAVIGNRNTSGTGGRKAATSAESRQGNDSADDKATEFALDRVGPLDETSLRAAVRSRLAQPRPSPGVSGGSGSGTAALGRAEAPAAPDCGGRLRAQVTPHLPPVALRLRTTWKGADAVVLAYRLDNDIAVYVVGEADCRIITFQRFSP